MGEKERKDIREGVLIRDFKKEDVDCVYKIIEENFPRPWIKEQILLENVFSYKVVLEKESKVIGLLFGEIIYEEANILLIAVKKEFQGKGFGKLLLEHFIEICKAKNVIKIFLEVATDNKKAVNLYKRYGFKDFSIRKKYYLDGSDAYLMVLEI